MRGQFHTHITVDAILILRISISYTVKEMGSQEVLNWMAASIPQI
jgi:hypothetical protein